MQSRNSHRSLRRFGWCVFLLLISAQSWGQECISGDCVDGQGTYTSTSGNKYIGEFKDNVFSGQGALTFPNGQYVGEFRDGSRHGQGTHTFPDKLTVEVAAQKKEDKMKPLKQRRASVASRNDKPTAKDWLKGILKFGLYVALEVAEIEAEKAERERVHRDHMNHIRRDSDVLRRLQTQKIAMSLIYPKEMQRVIYIPCQYPYC